MTQGEFLTCEELAFFFNVFSGAGWFATFAAGFFRWDEFFGVISQVGMTRSALDESAECSSIGRAESLSGF